VREPGSEARIWWGDVNAEISEESFERLRDKVVARLGEGDVYVIDAFAGSDPDHRIAVRVISESPWHALFAKTLFIEPTEAELEEMEPEALVLHAPSVSAVPDEDDTRTETFVCLHPSRTEVVIGGTFYAGEIKKSIFTVMNDRLPLAGVFPMHCSANVDDDGRVAVFFGLSGTGKTTLSADPQRHLIGDDEHGWSDTGSLQLRGRLLRQGHPAVARRRAGDLRYDPRVRDGAGERRDGRARRPRPGRRLEDGEHARCVQARADCERAAGEASRSSERGRLPHGRRVRDPPADRPSEPRPGDCTGSSRDSRPSSRHGDRRHEPQPTFSACFGARSCRSRRRSTPGCSARSSTRIRMRACGS
jgi:hypothetical protein